MPSAGYDGDLVDGYDVYESVNLHSKRRTRDAGRTTAAMSRRPRRS